MSSSVASSRSHRSTSSRTSQGSHTSQRSSKSARSHKSSSSARSNKSMASAPPSLSSNNTSTRHNKNGNNLHSIPENLSQSNNSSTFLRRGSSDNHLTSDRSKKFTTPQDLNTSDTSLLRRASSERKKFTTSGSFTTTASGHSSRSLLSNRSNGTTSSARGKNCESLVSEASLHYGKGNYILSVLLYTQVLAMYAGEHGNPVEGGTEERIERRLGSWYVGRGVSLWRLAEQTEVFGAFGTGDYVDLSKSDRSIKSNGKESLRGSTNGGSVRSMKSEKNDGSSHGGIYGAIAHDARMALECERISSCKGLLNSGEKLAQEEGALVRARALCLLGYSLLRQGIVEGVADAFEGSIDVAKLELQAKDCTTKADLEKTTNRAKTGLADLGRYEMLSTRLKKQNKRGHNVFLHDLCDVLKISPASDKWNIEMIRFLSYQQRWFAVANYCERVACKVLEVEKVFEGDLKEFHENSGGDPVELSPDFFEKTEEKDHSADNMDVPSYLRIVSDKAAADVAVRLSESLAPTYLRALRLEGRLTSAKYATAALMKMGGWKTESATVEIPLIESTSNLKEEADTLFRDGVFERAAGLYEQCLGVEQDSSIGGKLHASLHSNRASCFSSLGQYDEAIAECSAALDIHSMYMKVLLRRARCYAKSGDLDNAERDFQRWNILVEKAKSQPYPGVNIGPSCFFDMPSDVKDHDWNAVKSEMTELGISLSSTKKGRGGSLAGSIPFKKPSNVSRRSSTSPKRSAKFNPKKFFTCACLKNVKSQVVKGSEPQASVSGSAQKSPPALRLPHIPPPSLFRQFPSRNSSTFTNNARGPTTSSDFVVHELSMSKRDLSPRPDPPPQRIDSLNEATKIDINVDYYGILGCAPSASEEEIKLAYYKLVKLYHPDRPTGSPEKFEEVHSAYDILGDLERKSEYDKMRSSRLGVVLEP